MLSKVGHGFSVQKNWMPQFKAAFAKIAASEDTTGSIGSPAGTTGSAEPRDTAGGAASPIEMANRGAAPHNAANSAASPPGLSGLPLVEIPGASPASNTLAIILSGDGGWGKTEQGISRDLTSGGIGVVGWNSLRYYWKKRTPDEAARDLERIARHYLAAWHKTRLVLAGYSFGADVLPFLANRLPADLRGAVTSIVLIGMSHNAEFEFHFGDWLGGGPATLDYPTIPELGKLRGMRIFCFYGKHDSDILCSELDSTLAACITLPGGHRVRGNFAPISKVILEQVKR
ncbi:MAG: AcvB/VirJ family lysyl-phosphatidylglycerol hydrolase, partial [Candidatus Krumholzibacteriaceae bacterium]